MHLQMDHSCNKKTGCFVWFDETWRRRRNAERARDIKPNQMREGERENGGLREGERTGERIGERVREGKSEREGKRTGERMGERVREERVGER